MKRKIVLVVLTFAVGHSLFGQQGYQQESIYKKFKDIKDLAELCPLENEKIGFNSHFDKITPKVAKKIIDSLLDRMSLYKSYPVRECEAVAKNNAYAEIYLDKGKPTEYIVYSQSWLNSLMAENKSRYAAYFVLAHEVGHHQNDHRRDFEGSNKKIELQADEFAGNMLARMGASLDETLIGPRGIKLLTTKKYASHPGRIKRVQAAFKGWYKIVADNPTRRAKNREAIMRYHEDIKRWKQEIEDAKNRVKLEKEREEQELARQADLRKAKLAQEKAQLELERKEKKERDAAEEVLKNYFTALGGLSKINSIEKLKYVEKTTRSDDPNIYEYQYEQRSPTHLIITDKSDWQRIKLQFEFLDERLSYRFPNKKWKEGLPPNEPMQEEDFKEFIGSSTGDFLEDFSLFASPGLVSLKDTLQFNGVECYRLEVKEKRVEEQLDKNRTGFTSRLQQNRYYRTDNGLLEGIVKEKTIKKFKKGQNINNEIIKTTIKNKDYRNVEGVKFPHDYEIEIVTTRNSKVLETNVVTKKVEGLTFETKKAIEP